MARGKWIIKGHYKVRGFGKLRFRHEGMTKEEVTAKHKKYRQLMDGAWPKEDYTVEVSMIDPNGKKVTPPYI